MPFVAILMGSESDWPVMQAAADTLGALEIDHEVRITSAHRTPQATAEYVADAVARDCAVFICGAGMAAHLAGAVAAHTVRPVIGVPIDSGPLSGFDALLSTAQMPGGIPVSLADPAIAERLEADRDANRDKIRNQNQRLQTEIGG